jgi:hypothetical protein
MDDPHWTRQGQDRTIDQATDGAVAEVPTPEPTAPGAPVRVVASTEAGDRPTTGVAPTPGAVQPEAGSAAVQVHIGRVSIEIRQAGEPTPVRPRPAAPRQNESPSNSAGFSERRLRRLYLRGF